MAHTRITHAKGRETSCLHKYYQESSHTHTYEMSHGTHTQLHTHTTDAKRVAQSGLHSHGIVSHTFERVMVHTHI